MRGAIEATENPALLGWRSVETDQLQCTARIEGRLPAELQGSFYRNGPAVHERFGLRYRHLFDGDGMVQAFRFDGRGVSHRARVLATPKLVRETEAGRRSSRALRPRSPTVHRFAAPTTSTPPTLPCSTITASCSPWGGASGRLSGRHPLGRDATGCAEPGENCVSRILCWIPLEWRQPPGGRANLASHDSSATSKCPHATARRAAAGQRLTVPSAWCGLRIGCLRNRRSITGVIAHQISETFRGTRRLPDAGRCPELPARGG